MDELFLLPSAPVALPRAYWLHERLRLTSHIMLIQPSAHDFARVEAAITNAKPDEYDMEIINKLYNRSAMVLPHRRYALLSGELKKGRIEDHTAYLGDQDEEWDVQREWHEAKYVHFSDWPLPKV